VIVRANLLLAAVGAAGLLLAAALGAGPRPAGTVTFVAGQASRAGPGRSEALAVGGLVYEGDALETARRTRLEVKLADGSLLRLGPLSKVHLRTATFGEAPEDRKVTADLAIGNLWARVAKAVGGEARFEVQTENAVAGVRGTTFRVDAAKDRSVVVRVYGGTVAVAAGPVPRPGHAGGKRPERRQVAGPTEVTRERWERIVTSMMEVRVSAGGVPGDPSAFALADGDAWERWNLERDAAAH
jgi:hypothetical protein